MSPGIAPELTNGPARLHQPDGDDIPAVFRPSQALIRGLRRAGDGPEFSGARGDLQADPAVGMQLARLIALARAHRGSRRLRKTPVRTRRLSYVTTMREIDVRCAVCGTLQRTAELTSTSSFGPPDLDLRPSGPARWALEFRVQRCDACGYCAASIGSAPPRAGDTVASAIYREVLEQSKLPGLARTYFCAALVDEAAGRHEAAGWAFLSAAWDCDDHDATGRARSCRERAAEMFARGVERGTLELPRPVAQTLVAELWRRAGRFDNALESCDAAARELDDDASAEEEESVPTTAVVRFIRGLSIAGDDAAHNCAEAFTEGE